MLLFNTFFSIFKLNQLKKKKKEMQESNTKITILKKFKILMYIQ